MSKKLNTEPMSNEPNKPIAARELTEKELEGIVGGGRAEVAPGVQMVKTVKVQVEQVQDVESAQVCFNMQLSSDC